MTSTVIVEFCPATLKNNMLKAISAIMLFAALVMVAHCGTGCLPALSPEGTNYEADIIGCASDAGYPGAYDPKADRDCRARVDCAWHVGPCP